MLIRNHTRLASIIAVLCAAMPCSTMTQAQVVSDATGTIDLQLNPFFDTGPVSTGIGDEWVWGQTEPQHQYTPVGFADISASFDGDGYYSTGGISQIDYSYQMIGVGKTRIDMYSYVKSLNGDEGGGGHATIDFDITVAAPVRYRFEAQPFSIVNYYQVAFNGVEADAGYYYGTFSGTFPPKYVEGNSLQVGWETYIDEGILPAGTYSVSVEGVSSLYRLSASATEGTASLTIQLLGDADMDGVVGMDDLNAVLSVWNQTTATGNIGISDLNGDGFVGIDDLNEVLGNWGADVRPPAAVATAIPEPAGAAIVGLLSLTMITRKFRP